MCRPSSPSQTKKDAAKSKLSLPRLPRRSKLQRLRRLQKATRKQPVGAAPRPAQKSKVTGKRKQQELNANISAPSSAAPVEADGTVTKTAAMSEKKTKVDKDASVATSCQKLDHSVDAVALRKELQLAIEEDPYGDCPCPIRSFEELDNLPKSVLSSLKRHGITAPMPIQAQALPLVLSGRDVIGLAQTGSGKTLAFLLPASVHLEKLQQAKLPKPRVPSPSVLVVAPTRELAVQIADEANKVFDTVDREATRVNTVAVYGGGDKWKQQRQLQWGVDIIVATPGRLNDFVDSNVVSLSRVSYFVLDEADRMLDMGFHDEVSSFSQQVKPDRQVLFFSATWAKDVQQLAQGLCRSGSKPVRISYGQASDGTADAPKFKARDGIVQQVVVVDHYGVDDHWEKQEKEKDAFMDRHLREVLAASEEHKILVFVSRKDLADKLSNRLYSEGFKVDAMHGGKSQDNRLWVLDQFRKGELRLLVCTDVLGRGIDIPKVSHVVIHEMGDIEDYIHRIGRTARGQYGKGHALVFFEYWDKGPSLASDLIDVLAASKQQIPSELRRIADEVTSGKRKVFDETAAWNWKQQWKASSFSKQGYK